MKVGSIGMLMKSREGSLKVEEEIRDGNLGDGGGFKVKRLDCGIALKVIKGRRKLRDEKRKGYKDTR